MIGYNVSKINELMTTLANNYKSMGEKMAEGWPALSTTLEKEWIGPDEVSYETELAKNICNLYANCTDVINQLINSIKVLGENWQNFQTGNVLTQAADVASNAVGGSLAALEIPTLTAYDIASVVKAGNPVFDASTNMGLANGTSSGSTIKTQFNTYIDAVYSNVQALYTNLDNAVSSAFLGAELNSKLNQFLQKIGTSLAQLTTCHKSIYDALDTLIANYSTHETEEATAVSGASTEAINLNGENLK